MKQTINEEDLFIITQKIKGTGLRQISAALLANFGTKISHTAVGLHYKNKLNGSEIDTAIKVLSQDIAAKYSSEADANYLPAVDVEVIDKLRGSAIEHIDFYNTKGAKCVFAEQYAVLAGLMAGNFKDHIAGRCALNIDYIRYLKELRSLYAKPL